VTELLWWKDPRAAVLPGYAKAAAEIQRCEALGQGIDQAWVRVEDGRVVAIGNIDVSGCEN
jgi:hypothetical protein